MWVLWQQHTTSPRRSDTATVPSSTNDQAKTMTTIKTRRLVRALRVCPRAAVGVAAKRANVRTAVAHERLVAAGRPFPATLASQGGRWNLAGSELTPPWLLVRLAQDRSQSVCAAAVANPRCPLRVVATAAAHTYQEVRRGAASNPNCPPAVLHHLLRDPDFSVGVEAASNHRCRPEWVATLAESPDRDLRRIAALSPRCPPELLKTLSGHRLLWGPVAKNPNCPPLIMAALAGTNPGAVAANPACPTDLMDKIIDTVAQHLAEETRRHAPPGTATGVWRAERAHEDVLIASVRNPSCPATRFATHIANGSDRVALAAAKSPNCPVEVLQQLAASTSSEMRGAVAENPNCPVELLQQLADTKSRYVRLRVARHVATPLRLLAQFANDPDKAVRSNAVDNPALLIAQHYGPAPSRR